MSHFRQLNGNHRDLSILGVDPAYQKQGIGAALLQYGIEKADKNGLEIHVRSNIGS